jgi:hypothetical protein
MAIDAVLSGASGFDVAMETYQRLRDDHALPIYGLTCQLAMLQPPPLEMQQLLTAIQHDQAAMDRFAQMNAGTISPAEFFSAAMPRS